jgi:CRISPR-associated protein Csx14
LDDKGQPFFKETKYARVTLAPMPFFPLRGRLMDRMLKRPEAPGALMLSVVKEKRAELIVDLISRTLTWKGFQLDLSPAHMALYAFFVLSKNAVHRGDARNMSQHVMMFSIDYQSLNAPPAGNCASPRHGFCRRARHCFQQFGIVSLSKENFNSYRAKINREIERRFGELKGRDWESWPSGSDLQPGICSFGSGAYQNHPINAATCEGLAVFYFAI